jgi:thiosulfate/3-mercaptopyruvate sulfurtransferase
MPGSVNVPFDVLLNDRGELKPADDLEAVFQRVGVRDPDQEVVLSCGTGVTACVPALALVQLGFSNIKVYDGSWTEWASRDDTEVLTAA